MTRVNVDDVAFMDRRFKLLGGRLAITWQEALGRCLPVWALAYAKRTAILQAGDIDALAERAGFAAALVDVDLAAEDEGGLYLRGVADRIDFLLIQDAKREKARQAKLEAAGVASPRRPSRGTTASVLVPKDRPAGESPGTIPQVGPYSPDLDLAPDLVPEDQDLPPARDPAVPAPEPAPPPSLSATAERAETRRRVIAAAWQLGGEAFRKLGDEGIEPSAHNAWSGMPNAGDEAMKLLIGHVDRLLIGEPPDAERALAVFRRRIAVAVAEGRAASPPTRRWLTPMRLWNPTSFAKGAEMSPDQVRPRGGSRGDVPANPSTRPRSEAPPDRGKPPPVIPPEDKAGGAELAASLDALGWTDVKRSLKPATKPTADLVRMFGDARAGPSSSDEHLDTDDETEDQETA